MYFLQHTDWPEKSGLVPFYSMGFLTLLQIVAAAVIIEEILWNSKELLFQLHAISEDNLLPC